MSCTSGKMKNLEPSCFVLFLFCEKKKEKRIERHLQKQEETLVHCLYSFFFGLCTSKDGLIRLNKLSILILTVDVLVELRIVLEKT